MTDSILANITRHVELDPAERNQFIALLQLKTYQRQSFALQPGDIAQALMFVVSGCLRLYSTDQNGREHIVLFAPQDWWCTDQASFHAQLPAVYAIQALKNTAVLQITRPNLKKLYGQLPKFERFFRILFQNGFVFYQQRITAGLTLSAADRYQQFLEQYPKLHRRPAQKDIAAYLGVTPEFLSRLRRKR